MPDTSYTDGVTVIVADTMNDLNRLHYTILGDPTTVHDIRKKAWIKGADVGSAATVTVPTDGNFFHITGTTEIQGFSAVNAGYEIKVVFDGILNLTHGAGTLILPGGTSILTAAGDSATFINESAAIWRCVNYTSAAPAGVPAGLIGPYAGASAPSGWLLCFGQAVSRVTYAGLFSAISTVYGAGDGSTTFNLPDLRGRAIAGKDDMGGVSANRLTNQPGGLNGDVLGATGGVENVALTTAQLASHTHGVTDPNHTHGITDGGHSHGLSDGNNVMSSVGGVAFGSSGGNMGITTIASATTGISVNSASTGISTNAAGSGDAHNNVQPTIIMNYIIKY